ncbi:kinetochore protein NUF2, putative [Hepatocystis sp. ex Piliocolobus tephrosceles]|nr:kinetochore protein NUF2, putative [Hepatocystis sp. ex Piliocolobus tephrosceles]
MTSANEIVPRLGFEEMKNEMIKYGVDITHNTLKNPTTEDVQGVYSICIKYILNKDINNIRIEEFTGDLKSAMPSIDGIQILPNEGKNHLQAIGNLRFIRHCEKINRILNLDNTLSHIFKPISSHITKLINSFIHFMKYKEHIYNENDLKIRTIQEKKNEDSFLYNELKGVDNELNILLSKHDEIKNSISNEKVIKKNYEEDMINNQNLLNSQHSIIIDLKSKKDKIVNETNELVFQFSRYRQKKEDLEDQVVPSPEKLQKYNEELSDLLYEHISYFETDKKKNDDIKHKMNIADQCIQKLHDLSAILTTHVNEVIKIHIDKKNELNNIDKNYKYLIKEKENLIQNKNEQEQILQETEENFKQEQNKWIQKIEEEEKNITIVDQNVKEIYENVNNINMKINKEIQEINSIIKNIQDSINNYNKNVDIITNLIEKTENSKNILTNAIQNNIRKCIKTHI